jgi:hypothetical protein
MAEHRTVGQLAYTSHGPGAIAIWVCALSLLILVIMLLTMGGAYLYTVHVVDADRCRSLYNLIQATANAGVPRLHTAYIHVAVADGCSSQ